MKLWSLIVLFPSRSLLAAVALAGAFLPHCSSAQGDPGREVDELIRQLGDKSPKVREAATQRLVELDTAAPALRAALKSPDPEVARRAAWILQEMEQRPDRIALARLAEHVRNGEVDRAVEAFTWRSKWEDEGACWHLLTGLALNLIERGSKEFGAPVPSPDTPFLPVGDYKRYLDVTRPGFPPGPQFDPSKLRRERPGRGFVVRGQDISIGHSHESGALVAAVGSLRAEGGKLFSSVLYASGPVEMGDVYHSVIVCDGDLKVRTLGGSLVIVRGDIHCRGPVGNSLILLSGRFHLTSKFETIDTKTKLREKRSNFLGGFVKFFDPARAGVEVEPAKGGVRVKAVDGSKAFAKAGLRTGDVITAIDKEATADPEAFRRQLRSALARDQGPTLRVLRGAEVEQIRIPSGHAQGPPPRQPEGAVGTKKSP